MAHIFKKPNPKSAIHTGAFYLTRYFFLIKTLLVKQQISTTKGTDYYTTTGSGCGAAGRAVASDIRGPGFESSLGNFY